MNYTKLLPRFVQTRVEEIRSSKFKFRYIPSQENPVDIATRGLSPCKLRNNEQWWNGPDWLDQDESQWPSYQGQDEFEKAIIANMTTSPISGPNYQERLYGPSSSLSKSVAEDYLDYTYYQRDK
uniref:Reverse transcriptase n=1 Tax=Loa loa TaxID=7209 RepID=A0A1I7V6A3_LOALO